MKRKCLPYNSYPNFVTAKDNGVLIYIIIIIIMVYKFAGINNASMNHSAIWCFMVELQCFISSDFV